MKRYIFFILSSLFIISCNDTFFDSVPEDRLTLEETFKSRNLAEKYLANVYSFVPDEFNQRMGGGTAGVWTAGSSEAEYVWGFVQSQVINNGSLDPSHTVTSRFWTEYYKGISRASTFIDNIDKCEDMPASDKLIRKAEARALRAMYYFNLFKIYGPVVILGDKVLPPDASFEEVQLPRNSVEECIEFITKQLEMAANELPDTPPSGGEGRITKPIALAVRSQALLYAASPLFNGSDIYKDLKNKDGKLLFPQSEDPDKWRIAKEETKKFLDDYVPTLFNLYRITSEGKTYTGAENQVYDPYLSYREVVRGDNITNPELIFYRLYAQVSFFQYDMTPFHSGASTGDYTGGGGKSPTQEMVDLYFTSNGLRITEDPAYVSDNSLSRRSYTDPFNSTRVFAKINTLNQWVGREPRFYADITFNNSVWLKTDPEVITTTTYANGNSGKTVGQNNYPVTGYIVRKGAPLGKWNTSKDRACIMIRLAEIYLNYAEAANECNEFDEAIKYMNFIRQRAGIPEYGSPGSVDDNGFNRIDIPRNKEEIRKRIQRERAIELSFENHRYFDVRRWCVAGMAVGDDWLYPSYHLGGEGGDMHGLNIDYDPPLFFEKKPFEKRAFTEKHYLFPVPQNEINIDSELVQNTGWEVD